MLIFKNNIKIATVFITVWMLFQPDLFGQELNKVLVSPKEGSANTILVKWYTNQMSYPEGSVIYRKEKNEANWKRITASPIKPARELPAEAFNENPNLQKYIDFFQATEGKKLNGIPFLLLLLKSMESNAFAWYMGIYYEDEGVRKGKTYQYKVAFLKNGNEQDIGLSNEVTAGGYEPGPPFPGVEAIKVDTVIKFKWELLPDTYYGANIYRSTDGSSFEKINREPIVPSKITRPDGESEYPDFLYDDKDIIAGKSYQYRIRGIDFFNQEGNYSETKDFTFPAKLKDFPVPVGLQGRPNGQEVMLQWPAYTKKSFDGYHIYRKDEINGNESKITSELLSSSTMTFMDKVDREGTYIYWLAVIKNGKEIYSPRLKVEVIDFTPPQAPNGLTAVTQKGLVLLKWNPSTEPDLAGYLIYRGLAEDAPEKYSLLNAQPSRNTSYTDSLPENVRNKFSYKLVAVDTNFNKSSFASVTDVRLPDVTAPEKPYLKKIETTEEGLIVKWLNNFDEDLKGYNIYRSGDNKSNFEQINLNLIKPGVDRYTDNFTQPGVDYFYYIIAIDQSEHQSQPSNIISGRFTTSTDNTLEKIKWDLNYNGLSGGVDLIWKIPSGDLKGVIVFRKSGDLIYKPITGLLKDNEYKDTDLEKGKSYTYQLRIYQNDGEVFRSEEKTLNAD